MQQVVREFNSLVVDTKTADFIGALEAKDQLKEWVATRELFTCRIEVGAETNQYVQSFDLSGQCVALNPIVCKPGSPIHLEVCEGNNNVLLDERKTFGTKTLSLIAVSMFEAISAQSVDGNTQTAGQDSDGDANNPLSRQQIIHKTLN